MTKMLDEIRHALRALTKRPRFTAAAVLTLALGIAARPTDVMRVVLRQGIVLASTQCKS